MHFSFSEKHRRYSGGSEIRPLQVGRRLCSGSCPSSKPSTPSLPRGQGRGQTPEVPQPPAGPTMGQTMTKTEPQGGQAPWHRRSLALDPVAVTRRSGQDGLCSLHLWGRGPGVQGTAPGVWFPARHPEGSLPWRQRACGKKAGRGANRIGSRLRPAGDPVSPALRPAQTSRWECNPSSRLWALCGRHINTLTKGRGVTDAGKEGKSGPRMDHPLLPCRQSCGLCDGFLGNSMDAELKEMCSQAAGDTAADFFFLLVLCDSRPSS